MKKVMLVVVIMLIAIVCYLMATNYVVKTSDGIKLYPKGKFSFSELYTDMTTINFFELRHHKELVSVMVSHNDLKYVPGGQALIKLKKMGQNINTAITAFDDEYQLSNSLREISRIGINKYDEINKKHNLDRKAKDAEEYLKDKANKLNKWLEDK